MNVKQLKAIIAELPDHLEVLVPTGDHEYRPCRAESNTAFWDRSSNYYYEDHGDDCKANEEDTRKSVVLIH